MARSRARRLACAGTTVVLYAAAVAWLTWPLALRMGTHLSAGWGATPLDTPYAALALRMAPPPSGVWVAPRFDPLYAAWALAWESHALATAPTALPDANIYHP